MMASHVFLASSDPFRDLIMTTVRSASDTILKMKPAAKNYQLKPHGS